MLRALDSTSPQEEKNIRNRSFLRDTLRLPAEGHSPSAQPREKLSSSYLKFCTLGSASQPPI